MRIQYLSSEEISVVPAFLVMSDDDVLWMPEFGAPSADFKSSQNYICSYEIRSGRLERFKLPDSFGNGGVAADDGKGHVWVAWNRNLVRFDKSSHDSEEYIVPEGLYQVSESSREQGVINYVRSMVVGSDGRIWMAHSFLHSLTAFDPGTGHFQEVELPKAFGAPHQIAANGSCDDLWITVGEADGRSTTLDRVGHYVISAARFESVPALASVVAVETDGDAVYQEREGPGRLRRLSRESMEKPSAEFASVGGPDNYVSLLATGRSGSVWSAVSGAILRVKGDGTTDSFRLPQSTKTGRRRRGPLVPNADGSLRNSAEDIISRSIPWCVDAMVVDSEDNLWFYDQMRRRFGVVRP